MHAHGERLHDDLTDGVRRPARLEELACGAAERVAHLSPTRGAITAELTRLQPEKEGREADQGILFCAPDRQPRAALKGSWGLIRNTPPAPATSPRRTSGRANTACSAVTRMSQAGANSKPPPRA